jgi:hypothetical protein
MTDAQFAALKAEVDRYVRGHAERWAENIERARQNIEARTTDLSSRSQRLIVRSSWAQD